LAGSTVLCALGEVLVVPFALARANSGLVPKHAALILGGWLAASNALGFVANLVSAPLGSLPLLIVAVAGCAAAGVLLLVKRDALERWGLPPAPADDARAIADLRAK